jgi:hypothetical protein
MSTHSDTFGHGHGRLMTAPLLIVPCGQLLEGVANGRQSVAVRFGICAAALGGSSLAEFRASLIFVGCACVGMVSFVRRQCYT